MNFLTLHFYQLDNFYWGQPIRFWNHKSPKYCSVWRNVSFNYFHYQLSFTVFMHFYYCQCHCFYSEVRWYSFFFLCKFLYLFMYLSFSLSNLFYLGFKFENYVDVKPDIVISSIEFIIIIWSFLSFLLPDELAESLVQHLLSNLSACVKFSTLCATNAVHFLITLTYYLIVGVWL